MIQSDTVCNSDIYSDRFGLFSVFFSRRNLLIAFLTLNNSLVTHSRNLEFESNKVQFFGVTFHNRNSNDLSWSIHETFEDAVHELLVLVGKQIGLRNTELHEKNNICIINYYDIKKNK